MKAASSIFFLLSLCQYGLSQSFDHQFLSVSDGLPHSCVFRIQEAKDDPFLWIGTDNGICRFDGYEFRSFIFDSSVYSNYILTIHPLSDERLLLSYYRDGLFVFDNGKLSPFEKAAVLSKDDQKLLINGLPIATELKGVTQVAEFAGYFWLVSSESLFFSKNDTFHFHSIEPSNEVMVHVLLSANNTLLAGTEDGVYQIHDLDSSSKVWPTDGSSPLVAAMSSDTNGNVYLATDIGLYMAQAGNTNFLPVPIPASTPQVGVKMLKVDSKNRVWFSTGDQKIYVLENGLVTSLHIAEGDYEVLVNDIEEDYEGNIWLATMASGICRVSIADGVSTLKISDQSPNFIRTLFQSDDGVKWAGTYGHVYASHKDGPFHSRDIPLPKNELVYNFLQGGGNEVIAGTSKGTFVFENGTFSHLNESIEGVLCADKAPDGTLWFGTRGGLYRSDSGISNYRAVHLPEFGPAQPRINFLLMDSEEKLWMATENKLYTFYENKVEEIDYPVKARIKHIFQSSKGALFFSTPNGLMKRHNNQWKVYQRKDPNGPLGKNELISNHCIGVLEGSNGNIWIVTDMGLVQIIDDKELNYYNLQSLNDIDGIYSMAAMANDRILLGTLHRLIEVDIEKLDLQNAVPIPYIKQVLSSGKKVVADRGFVLPYSENNLQVVFSNISFRSHSDGLFYYRINKDEEWQYSLNGVVNYKALAPGAYQFELKTGSRNEMEVSAPIGFHFSVEKPFWQEAWFILLTFLGLGGMVYLIFVFRLRKIRKKNQVALDRELELSTLKHQALNAMMNPHFITNSLNAIRQMAASGYQDKIKANRYVVNFSGLVNINLEQAANAYITLEKELERLRIYLEMEQLRLDDRFDFEIEIHDEVDPEEIEVPNMILQPLAENSIWHGFSEIDRKGMLQLKVFFQSDNVLLFQLDDNGTGYSPTLAKRIAKPSFGLKMVKEKLRLQSAESDLYIKDLEDKGKVYGTRVCIQLWVE